MVTEAGVKALPTSGSLRNIHAYQLLAVGRFAEAVRELEAYSRIAPREPNPYDSLGEAHLIMGEPERALDYYGRALQIDPSFVMSNEGRAWCFATLGRYDDALAEKTSVASTAVFLYSRVGRYREADARLATAVREAEATGSHDSAAALHLLSSLLALEQADFAAAVTRANDAKTAFSRLPAGNQRLYRVVFHLLAGTAEARARRVDAARAHLEQQQTLIVASADEERWWRGALEGEVALAAGNLPAAASAFAGGEPTAKMKLSLITAVRAILSNNLPMRDGLARVGRAQGDRRGAIEIYRRLLAYGRESKWTAMLEPRFVLALARLLDETGQKDAARREYERFAALWKHADPGLPELAEARRALDIFQDQKRDQ